MDKSDFRPCLWYQVTPKTVLDPHKAIQIRKCESGWQVQAKRHGSNIVYHIFGSKTYTEALDWVYEKYFVEDSETSLKNQLKDDIAYLDKAVNLYDHEIARRISYALEYIKDLEADLK